MIFFFLFFNLYSEDAFERQKLKLSCSDCFLFLEAFIYFFSFYYSINLNAGEMFFITHFFFLFTLKINFIFTAFFFNFFFSKPSFKTVSNIFYDFVVTFRNSFFHSKLQSKTEENETQEIRIYGLRSKRIYQSPGKWWEVGQFSRIELR